MGVYANGQLIYGFVNTNDMEDLFEAIASADNNSEEGYAFEELHPDLQEKHHISLSSVGYNGVDILSAFSANASAKGMDIQTINADKLAKTEEYKQNVLNFLREAGIEHPEQYTPQWHILGYMD